MGCNGATADTRLAGGQLYVLHWQINGSHQIHNGGTNISSSIRKVDGAKLAAHIRTMVVVLLQVVSHIGAISLLEIFLLPLKMLATIGIKVVSVPGVTFIDITIQVNALDATIRT